MPPHLSQPSPGAALVVGRVTLAMMLRDAFLLLCPPVAAAAAAPLASLHVLPGATINPHLFGYDLEEWGSPLNLTYNDTAGLALTEALHPGVLRYPSGTGSNIWDTVRGRFIPAPAGNDGGYGGWLKYLAPPVNNLPIGTFSGASFLAGLGGKARRVIWAVNVYSLNTTETCEQIEYISRLPGQQEPGVLLELGNELGMAPQGMPKYPNATVYAEAMVPIVECARRLMPKAKVGACGWPTHGWNDQLRPYFTRKPPLFDGLSKHQYLLRYAPGTDNVLLVPLADRVSYIASYSWWSAFQNAKSQLADMGVSTPVWLTEFGFGLDHYNASLPGDGCLLETLNLTSFGALHGVFHAGRILGAINAQVGCSGAGCAYGAVTFETFVYRDPAPTLYPLDWCGMPAGTVSNCAGTSGTQGEQPAAECAGRLGQKNRPDLARVTGTGQLVAHLSARALAMDTMHAVNVTGGPNISFAMRLGDQPCIQAAAFRRSETKSDGTKRGVNSTTFAILNICNTTIAMSVGATGGTAVAYDLLDKGGKAPLPAEPDKFPWASGPLRAKEVALPSSGVYTAPPLSFTIVESFQLPPPPPPPAPPPPPPPPPPPVPPGVVSLHVQPGVAVNPHFFGYVLEEWGSPLNLTYNDTAGHALTEALHPGVLRYPGGTGGNIWDPMRGRYLPAPPHTGYGEWERDISPAVNALPEGTFSAASFLQGFGGKAKRVLWNLNVYTFNQTQACAQIRYIAGLPGQQEPGVLLELGNELYSPTQGPPYFMNGSQYAEAMVPIVACARKLMPKAKIAACGGGPDWVEGLRPYFHHTPPLFDGLTHHQYSPAGNARVINSSLPQNYQVSYVAGYSRVAAVGTLTTQHQQLGVHTPMWLTEFGYGLGTDHGSYNPDSCVANLLFASRFGALHGAFHAGRILAAINTQIGCAGTGCNFAAVTFETFVFRDPAPTNYPADFCGMPAGTVANCAGSGDQQQPEAQCVRDSQNRPDLARVTGTGQLVAHLSARALAMETMHAVNVTGTPMMKFDVGVNPQFYPDQPCIQAAAFQGASAHAAGVSTVFAILNICDTTIAMTLPVGEQQLSSAGAGTAIVYDLLDEGGKAPLPEEPDTFPWKAPLTAQHAQISSSGVYTVAPLSFAVVEVNP